MTRLQAVCMAALWLLGLCSSALGGYRIGVGKSDITGPVAEVVMMGYADMSQKATGLLNRLYARAFIIENTATQQRVVYVNCDIHGVYQLVHQAVINQLQATYDGLYTEQNVVLHATHTHGGPGGASAYFLYDVSILGFIKENFEAIVGGILNAIAAAHDSVEPGSVHFNKGKLMNGGKNRSPDAYLANPAHERAQYTTKHDVDMRALHFRSSNGTLRGILAWFPVHPTSLTQFNKMISGDNKGYAEFLVEQRHPGVIVGVGISNAGDISPNLIDNGDGTFRGEGKTDVESAEIIGRRQADTLMQLLETPNEVLQGSVVGRLSYVDFSNVHIKNADATARNPYAHRTCPAVMGQNFAAGTEDGRGLPWFREGDLTTNTLFSTLGSIVKRTPEWVRVCQSSNKAPLLAVGLMWPVPWVPEVLPVQVIKIGQFAIAVTNFEVSTMSGRRLRSKVQEALAITGVSEVEIASMSNAYAQYLTTAEEYAMQHYEGASTLFGPNQQAAVEQELVRVAQSVADPSIPLDVGSPPRQFDRERLITFQTGVILDTAGWGKSFGDVRVDTKAAYEIGDIVITEFYGAHPKNLLSNVTSFCDVEKEDETTGRWVTYLTDAHWDVRYEWNRVGISESRSVCSWHLRESDLGTKPGRYRLRHRGYYKPIVGSITPYTGVSSPFEVVVSSAGNQVKLALSCTTSESCAAV